MNFLVPLLLRKSGQKVWVPEASGLRDPRRGARAISHLRCENYIKIGLIMALRAKPRRPSGALGGVLGSTALRAV